MFVFVDGPAPYFCFCGKVTFDTLLELHGIISRSKTPILTLTLRRIRAATLVERCGPLVALIHVPSFVIQVLRQYLHLFVNPF